MSEVANLVFQRIFVLNSVKCKFFHAIIVNTDLQRNNWMLITLISIKVNIKKLKEIS